MDALKSRKKRYYPVLIDQVNIIFNQSLVKPSKTPNLTQIYFQIIFT